KDTTTDETTNNGQDKKDTATEDSTSEQGNSTDVTDSTDSQENNTDTTDSDSNNDQEIMDDTDTTDSNNYTDQSNETDEINSDTIIDPLDLFNPDAVIDLDDFLDSLDPGNALDPDIDNEQGNQGDQNDQEDQEDQDDQQEPESDWNFHHPGYYGTWSFTVYQGHDAVGYGYFTRSEGEPDEAEFYIPLDTITDEVDGITEISMTIKKLGKQSVICVGADTAPYIGVAISSAIVLMSVAGYSYKKQRPLILKKGK
ncbi:MAG: hypothetical protein AAGU75_07665, partial [Bacillota bacterium]